MDKWKGYPRHSILITVQTNLSFAFIWAEETILIWKTIKGKQPLMTKHSLKWSTNKITDNSSDNPQDTPKRKNYAKRIQDETMFKTQREQADRDKRKTETERETETDRQTENERIPRYQTQKKLNISDTQKKHQKFMKECNKKIINCSDDSHSKQTFFSDSPASVCNYTNGLNV